MNEQLVEEVPELDTLYQSANHEAGHKIMLESFGCYATAEVWKNVSGNPDEYLWCGHCRYICPLVQQQNAKNLRLQAAKFPDELRNRVELRTVKLPSNWRMLVGVAGLVAEQIYAGIDDPAWVVELVLNEIENGYASDTDLAGMGISDIYNIDKVTTKRGIRQAFRHLLKSWQLVQDEAKFLVACALKESQSP